MAAVESMGEVDEVHSKGEGEILTNGEISNNVEEEESKQISKSFEESCDEQMEVDNAEDTKDTKDDTVNNVDEDSIHENESASSDDMLKDDNEEADEEQTAESPHEENTDEDADNDEKRLDNETICDVKNELENVNDSEERDTSVSNEDPLCVESVTANESEEGPKDPLADKIEDEKGDSCDDKDSVKSEKSTEKNEGSEKDVSDTINEEKPEDVENKDGAEDKEDTEKKDSTEKKEVIEIHEILDDDDDDDDDDDEEEEKIVQKNKENGVSKDKCKANETIELNDSADTDGEGDVMIVEDNLPKQNGPSEKRKAGALEIIDLDKTIKKQKVDPSSIAPRRSSRNLNKQKSYAESDKEEEEEIKGNDSEESDIEEVLPEDPLAVMDAVNLERVGSRGIKSGNSSTIVVKDTKKLVEIASKSNNATMTVGKKEPTLVIIDTNSILSGRGPVPVLPKSQSTSKQSLFKQSGLKTQTLSSQSSPVSITHTSPYPTLLPMALPAQGMYPPNMRATITPIPVSVPAQATASIKQTPPAPQPPPLLPTLTDDMFVVEAPSFIVPYVYEKPPKKEFKGFIKDMEKEIIEQKKKREESKELNKEKQKPEDSTDSNKTMNSDKSDDSDKLDLNEDAKAEIVNEKETKEKPEPEKEDVKLDIEKTLESKKPYSYFESPLGKFFIDIGMNLVQEFVQTDILKQQKRKREREGGQNSETNKTIHSLMKNLEYSKENNSAFKMTLKKCEFCHFKTESALALAYHMETPHMKNYVYRCNFCTYEVRSPHDILFHMEAEHAVKGRLERAPSFHQCSNCPFEDNQKGKLSRHLVACARKFKPDRNLEPPIDWEPPAKIPRVPKMRQQGLNAAAYQAMSKTSQYQFLSKMQLQSTNAMNRGRGRPNLTPIKPPIVRPPTGMVYKQTMSGGSVLVPANYQLAGNQVFQVLGGQELGGRLGHPGHMAFLPTMSSASSTFSSMQQQQQQSSQQQQQQQSSSVQKKPLHQPSISITPLPRASTSSSASPAASKPGDTNAKNSFVICEICDGYIKDLEQLRNHMQWIHKIKIHPKMIHNRPPLNCQKCQYRFFTDQGLERHLLGSHGLVTSSMQDAANKSKDAGRCPVCGRVYQWKLLNHVARDHNMTLKPAHLSYKCTVCTATFGMYKQFENHVYSAHSVVAKRIGDKKGTNSTPSNSNSKNDLMKPLKINDEITIIPQPNKTATSKEGSPASTGSSGSRTGTPSTSKTVETDSPSTSASTSTSGLSRAERLARRTANGADD